MRPLNEDVDRRHLRRAMSAKDLAALCAATERRPVAAATKHRVNRGVTPKERVKLLALGRIAARCGVSRRTVWSWISAGHLVVVRLGRRIVRIREPELAEFILGRSSPESR
jgi:excisionase family DNA binding protein